MRVLLLAGAALGTLGLSSGAASAREYPWCSIGGGNSGAWSCGYDSLEQCMANRRERRVATSTRSIRPPRRSRARASGRASGLIR